MESDPEQTSEGKAVVAVLAAVLDRLVNSNAHVPGGENITKFHALKAPGISIKQYLERVSAFVTFNGLVPTVTVRYHSPLHLHGLNPRSHFASIHPSTRRYTNTHRVLPNALSSHSSTSTG